MTYSLSYFIHIGYWTEITSLMQYLGIYMSMAIFTIAESSLDQYSTFLRVIIFLTTSQVSKPIM